MITGLSLLFIATVLFAVRYLQRRKQDYLLALEKECGIDIKLEKVGREKERIRVNFLLSLASIPFAIFPFICFFLFMDSGFGLELLPVMIVAWGMIYFWFATEHYNVFRKSITYEEIITGVEKAYFKRAYSPFIHIHETMDAKYLPQYLLIRNEIRTFMALLSEPHCDVSNEEIDKKQEKLDELCWELNQNMKEKGT